MGKKISLFIFIFQIILFKPIQAIAAPKEIYTDPETGNEVWRMTNALEMDIMQYYDFPTISPNGKHLMFRTARAPFIYIINTDGTVEQPIGDWWTWNSPSVGRGIDFSTNNLQGWWSHDSRYFYTFNKLYVIDIEKLHNGAAPDDYISQISSTHAENFYYPMLSPDGRTLFGVGNGGDICMGDGTVKFINVDGTNYREYVSPGRTSGGFDVTHGWLGNNHAWYLNDNKFSEYDECLDPSIDKNRFTDVCMVFNVNTGLFIGPLHVTPDWDGLFTHPVLSDSGILIGGGKGYLGGNGRGGFRYANTLISTDPVIRELNIIGPGVSGHYMFSPDAKWVSAADKYSPNSGFVVAYPVQPSSTAVKIARYTYNDPENLRFSSDPRFSPDATKNIYYGDVKQADNYDIYMAIFKKPDPPTNLQATPTGDNIYLTFQPAAMHREIKEYEIYKSTSQTGDYTKIGVLPETITYLNAPSKIGINETTIYVDSTTDFPDSGVIEISGLSTELPNELLSYSGKTATAFTGCTRGIHGTTPAEHYNDAFIWLYTGDSGYTDTNASGIHWYKVKSVEWSGLKSEFSEPVIVNQGTPSPSPSFQPCPADLNSDGQVDYEDFRQVLGLWGQSCLNCQEDLKADEKINTLDLAVVIKDWGECQ